MEKEAKFGPTGIWKKNPLASSNNVNNDENGDDDDDNDDDDDVIYDQIRPNNLDDSDSDSDSSNKKSKKIPKSDRAGDFKRNKGAVGLVLQDELVSRGIANDSDDDDDDSNESDNDSNDSDDDDDDNRKVFEKQHPIQPRKSKKNDTEGFDEVALRNYELSKLRYYFAIATCDSVETASSLYTQLDGIELEHSSMAFDLRFVPDDVDFSERDIRDECSTVPALYKAPDFIVNALQHSNVQCSWDEGEKEREKKLSNISQWRELNESEFQQYIASSDSDSDSDDGKTDKMRKLLNLGNGSDEDSDDEVDDFFIDEEKENNKKKKSSSSSGYKEGEEGNFTFSYIPMKGKDLIDKKREKDNVENETPFELSQRKHAERKAAKNKLKRDNAASNNNEEDDDNIVGGEDEYADFDENMNFDEMDEMTSDDDSNDDSDNNNDDESEEEDFKIQKGIKKYGSKPKPKEIASKEELELLYAGEDNLENDYDMRDLVKEEKLKNKKGKSKKNKLKLLQENKGNDNFELNLEDDRFKKLYDGDSKFGIDRTSNEFKETKVMKEILDVQSSRRDKKQNDNSNNIIIKNNDNENNDILENNHEPDSKSLVEKLKRKFGKVQDPEIKNKKNKSKKI
jgi:hypothetical protein